MGRDNDVRWSLDEVDPGNGGDVRTVTDLHLKLIGRGEIAQLGRVFLERVCYRLMVRDGLLKAFLYRVNGKPAGFITFTPYPVTLHRRAVQKRLPSIALLMAWSLIRHPRTIIPLGRAVRLIMMRRREIDIRREPAGEILAIGVLPEYRTPQFIHQTGLRIADELFRRSVSYFRSLGLEKMDIFYYDFQMATLLFYRNLGGAVVPCRRDGRSLFHITFDFERIEKSS